MSTILKAELRSQRQVSRHGQDSGNIKLPAARFLSSGRTCYPIHVSYQNSREFGICRTLK
jgi:hypothetical protein